MTPSLLLQALRDPASVLTLSMPEWDLLLRQASTAKLMGCLLCMFNNAGLTEQLPVPVRAHFDWTAVLLQRHTGAVAFEISRNPGGIGRVGPRR